MQTKLQVVNYLLSILGSAPIGENDLETTLHPLVATAKQHLEDATLEIQKNAWWFNQEYHFRMIPNETTKEITVPWTVLQVDVLSHVGIIKRGNRLYNTITHSYQFDTPIIANQVVNLDFTLLDEIVIDAIRYFAGWNIAENILEDNIKARNQENLYIKALVALRKADLKAQRRNILNSPTASRLIRGTRHGRAMDPHYPGGG